MPDKRGTDNRGSTVPQTHRHVPYFLYLGLQLSPADRFSKLNIAFGFKLIKTLLNDSNQQLVMCYDFFNPG